MILQTMLQRLFASLVHGPSMNARPHHSRQRCDFTDLAAFSGKAPTEGFRDLLQNRSVEFPARVQRFTEPSYPEAEWSDDQKKAKAAYTRQTKLLKKLRDIAEDARDYMNDHGESCLSLGFPLISMPPANDASGGGKSSSRILAPLLLMPIDLSVRVESRPGISLRCVGEGTELLVANPALLAWLERQTGKAIGDLFTDEEGSDPWAEISDLLKKLTELTSMESTGSTSPFDQSTDLSAVPALDKLPKGTQILPSAVLGLFPLSNQSLLKDTRWMIENEVQLMEPVSSFLKPEALNAVDTAEYPEADEPQEAQQSQSRQFNSEWIVSAADPCQANAVVAARAARAMVVHGPPGTGKSQTITNMIADHLARRERVLFVCDKRTALDVVKYRLDSLGLGDLCGIVHDPNADRKRFYMSLREQLEGLSDVIVPENPGYLLKVANERLSEIHRELNCYREMIHHSPAGGGESFHDLLGLWLELSGHSELLAEETSSELTRTQLEAARTTLDEISRKAESAQYTSNPLSGKIGISAKQFFSMRSEQISAVLDRITMAAEALDATPCLPAPRVNPGRDLAAQAAELKAMAEGLQRCSGITDQAFISKVLSIVPTTGRSLLAELEDAQVSAHSLMKSPLDSSMIAAARASSLLNLPKVNENILRMAAYDEVRGSFFKRLFNGRLVREADEALRPLGLNVKSGFDAGKAFFTGLKQRLLLADLISGVAGEITGRPHDDTLLKMVSGALDLLTTAKGWQAAGMPLPFNVEAASGENARHYATQFDQASERATLTDNLLKTITDSGLFKAEVNTEIRQQASEGALLQPVTVSWRNAMSSIEDLVRLDEALARLPEYIKEQTLGMVKQSLSAEMIYSFFKRGAIENELRGRLESDPDLYNVDSDRIEAAFSSFHKTSAEKATLVKQHIQHVWISHQKARLLASTGSQLNKQGAALRSRLFVKGKKALKLRQMLATGADAEDGDPVYDLCPVWMASPATVAQIFPRRPIFDVVIFDEASQCRLEEALPVLLRGHRVVIAGDQKQLPPTRFFESALADSGDSDAESAEELFIQQQSEAEDLLSAALNLDVKEAYLDVHYRSQNEALIGFSNDQYYGSRLQPIPGHPRNKALGTPIVLHQVNGVYEERANVQEAKTAAELVSSLLAQDNPPSIGLACFNLTQRDALLDALGELSDSDPKFATRLEEARNRKGKDSAEGLFVKNLENVQGDERDVIIISTTFGLDKAGKFRRNFGALSQREGGRRLNVLVTRARIAIHVLTSIPEQEYNAIEPIVSGQVPNGRLQLYAYLRYARHLEKVYAAHEDALEQMRTDTQPVIQPWESKTPSKVALSLAGILLNQKNIGSHVHWGNEGFCVDLAGTHPLMPADVTVGVMTDFTRFHKTPDPIEWDMFRTKVLRDQGWEIQRLWSPVLFRKLDDSITKIQQAHQRLSAPPQVDEVNVLE